MTTKGSNVSKILIAIERGRVVIRIDVPLKWMIATVSLTVTIFELVMKLWVLK